MERRRDHAIAFRLVACQQRALPDAEARVGLNIITEQQQRRQGQGEESTAR